MAEDKVLVMVGAHPDDDSSGRGSAGHYVQKGVKVYYICGTRGGGSVPPDMMNSYSSIAQLRTYELECAAKTLGLTEVIFLGYRDSGMAGSPDNNHPEALVAAPLDEVAGIITSHIRHLKPQVVLTFDPVGGYHHPDHIMIHNATVKAFHAAGDPAQYPDKGEPCQLKSFIITSSARLAEIHDKDAEAAGTGRASLREEWISTSGRCSNNFRYAVVKLTKKAARRRESGSLPSQLGEGSGRA